MNALMPRALKEWDIICTALCEGSQMLLIRKGGIREEGGQFHAADSEFFLYSTFEHQKEELLKPQWAARLKQEPSVPPHKVCLRGYAQADCVLLAQNEQQLQAAEEFHICNNLYVEQRFNYNPYDPLTLMLLRVYAFDAPVQVEYNPEYGGCRSWITLQNAPQTIPMHPALSQENYLLLRRRLLDALGESALQAKPVFFTGEQDEIKNTSIISAAS